MNSHSLALALEVFMLPSCLIVKFIGRLTDFLMLQ